MSNAFVDRLKPEAVAVPPAPSSNLECAKIVVFGTFGAGNIGNECTLQAMLYNIRRRLPAAEIICICSGPEETAANYRVSTFAIRDTASVDQLFGAHARRYGRLTKCLTKLVRLATEPYRWYKACKMLKGKDRLVITGLGMLGDFGISPFGLHYDILGWSVVAKLCGCKLEFVSVGVGPIRDLVSKCFVKTALALGDYRSYRDSFSKEYLERIGFNTMHDHVYPDLAFSLPKSLLPGRHKCGHRQRVIGVGLMPYYGRRGRWESGDRIYREYIASVASVTCMLMDRGYTIRLLIGDSTYDHGVRRELRASLEAREAEYVDGQLVDEPASSVAELLSQLASTDVVVASRYHNLLLAVMLGKPVVAVSYHEKIVSVMDELGLSRFCHDIENFNVDTVVEQITTLEMQRGTGACRRLIEERVESYRNMLDDQYEFMF